MIHSVRSTPPGPFRQPTRARQLNRATSLNPDRVTISTPAPSTQTLQRVLLRAAPIPEEKTRYSPLKLPLSRDNPTKILKARENDIREVAEHGGGLREELQQAATLEELRQVKQRWSTRQVPNPHRAALLHRLHRTGGYVEAIDFYRESASRHKDFVAGRKS